MEDKPRILVVDDDESTRGSLTLVFGRKGYETGMAGTGREALEKAQGNSFDLAILDIRLSDMEGVELIAPLKEMHPDIVVIMATAYASLESAVQALNEGASAYIIKPLNIGEVLATVGEALEKQRLVRGKRQADERMRRLLDQQIAVNRLALALGESRDLDTMYHIIYEYIQALMDAKAFIVSFYDKETQFIRAGYAVAYGTVLDAAGLPPIPLEEVGYGTQSQVIRTGQMFYAPDLRKMMERTRTEYSIAEDGMVSEGPPSQEEEDISRSSLYAPLKVEGETIGVMQVQSHQLDAYSQEDMDLLAALASVAAVAIHNAQLVEETQRQSDRLAQTLVVSEVLHRGLKLEQVLEQIARGAVALGFRRAVINVCQLEEDLVRVRALVGLKGPEREALVGATYHWSDFQTLMQERFQVSHSYLIRHGEVDWEREFRGVVVAPSREDRGPGYWRPGDALLVPLWGTHGEPVGLLSVDEPVDGLFPDLSVVQTLEAFANQAAIAIENARLYEQSQQEIAKRVRAEGELQQSYVKLRRALGETVNALVSAIEMRDPYTAGHQQRVANLACAIAKEMGLPEDQIEGLRMAGLIHDIGKINIPVEILSKPGGLSDIELSLIKIHPQHGYDILKSVDFPWPVAQIVLQHHERMDGSGFPKGLSGDDILLEARILAVADVVEAMASYRPYRPAHGLDKALEEISENRGVLYDPEVADACLRLFTEKRFTFE